MKSLFKILFLLLVTNCYGQDSTLLAELNPDSFNQNFTLYDQKTSLFCGQLSELAYWNKSKVEKTYQELKLLYPNKSLNYELLENKHTDAQALLWCGPDFLVISFRGTEPSILKDWFSDAKFWNYQNNPTQNDHLANMPPGHGGFRKSLMSLINDQQLFQKINDIIKKTNPDVNINDFPVFLTGHSLGAAISQLFIECLTYKGYKFAGAYHFAPPLAVSCAVNTIMREKYGNKVYDIINYKDYVPRAGRNGVAHFGKFYRICDDHLLYKEPDAYVKFSKGEYLKVIKYHSLDNHLLAIRDSLNTTQKIKERSIETFGCMGDNIQTVDPCAFIVE